MNANLTTDEATYVAPGDGAPKKVLDEIICPVVATMLNRGLITLDDEGRTTWLQIAEAAGAIGVGADLIKKVFGVMSKGLTEEEKRRGVVPVNLRTTALNHGT